MGSETRGRTAVGYFLRFALGAAFLSAVADRFGWWGPPGTPGVVWGAFEHFAAYTATLNPFVPTAAIPALAWAVTVLEIVLGLFLLAGFRLKETALASALLLLAFAVAMALFVGIKAPFDYSVFSASAAAFALAVMARGGGG